MSTSSTTSYKNLPTSEFIPDREQRDIFFAKCRKDEKNYAYLKAEIKKRTDIIPNVFALCAKLCSGDDYPNIKDLPAEAFDILFPQDGLQSCHWQMLLDHQSNNFLAKRLAHFNDWVGANGLPPNLAEMRNEHLATLALAAAKEQGALAANQQLSASFQAAVSTTQAVMHSYNHMVSQLTAERDAALAAATLAAAALAAASGGSSSSDPSCWYCQNNRCNKHL